MRNQTLFVIQIPAVSPNYKVITGKTIKIFEASEYTSYPNGDTIFNSDKVHVLSGKSETLKIQNIANLVSVRCYEEGRRVFPSLEQALEAKIHLLREAQMEMIAYLDAKRIQVSKGIHPIALIKD